jgi:uncharacterized protein (DUF58 family)
MADKKAQTDSLPETLTSSPFLGGAATTAKAFPTERGLRGRLLVDSTKETQFSDAWTALAALLFFVGLIFHQGALIVIAGMLILVSAIGWAWDRLALGGIEYTRRFAERRAFVGETIALDLSLVNRKPLPVGWVRVVDRVPMALPIDGIEVTATDVETVGRVTLVFALRWFERVSRHYTVRCLRRGFYQFGPVELEAGDVFGLFSRRRRLDRPQWFIVYPKVESLADLGLPPKEPFGPAKASRQLFDDPIRTVGVRDYRPEDELRRIHWKATARRQELQSRVYEPSTAHNLVIMLNVATLAKHWQGYIPERLERVVSVSASVAAFATEMRWPVGVIANGALPKSDQAIKVLPGRGAEQLMRVMEALAAVSSVATKQFEDLIRLECPRLPWGSTLVIVTSIVTDPLKATLADLNAEGRRVVLVTLGHVDEADPLLRGILVRSVAGGLPAGQVVQFGEGEGLEP